MPAWCLFQNSLRKGGSVLAFWVTAYCIGVSFCFSSASGGFWNVCIALLVNGDEALGRWLVAVCATARDQPIRATAPRAAAAASQAIGFTGFMQDNSTTQAALKIPPRPSGGCGIARSAAPESGAGVSPAFPSSGDHHLSFLFASSHLRCSPLLSPLFGAKAGQTPSPAAPCPHDQP